MSAPSNSATPITGTQYTQHEQYADSAEDYLDKHNLYSLFSSYLSQLIIHHPSDPISFLITLCEQPSQQARIVVVAPPHPVVAQITSQVVREFGLQRLHFHDLVAAEQNAAYNANNIPDTVAIPLLSKHTNSSDALNKGWLLQGYPTSKTQAQALVRGGILPTHLLFFQLSPQNTQAFLQQNNESLDELEKEQWKNYEKISSQIQEVFHQSKITTFLDLSQSASALFSQIHVALTSLPPSAVPQRLSRIVLLGKRGAGKMTQARKIKKKHGVVLIHVGDLLRQECKTNFALRDTIAPYIADGRLVPDDVVVPLVINRLLSNDARKDGWVLVGFPRTAAQAAALSKSHITPSRVIHLDVSDSAALDRVEHRRVDPVTGDVYHVVSSPPPRGEIAKRVEQLPADKRDVVTAINFTIESFLPDVLRNYTDVSKKINGELSQDAVFRQIEDFILSPLNHHYFNKSNSNTKQDAGANSKPTATLTPSTVDV